MRERRSRSAFVNYTDVFNAKWMKDESFIYENGQEVSQRTRSHSFHLLVAPIDPIWDLLVDLSLLFWCLHQVNGVFSVVNGLNAASAFISNADLLGADGKFLQKKLLIVLLSEMHIQLAHCLVL